MSRSNEATILLLGATGQVGYELRRSLAPLGSIEAPGRDRVDLTAPDTLREAVRSRAPDAVVNAAAYTAVDDAENDAETAAAINAHAPGVLAEAAQSVGAWMVHYSTDYVFDGADATPYREGDPPNPVNVYGRTKWDGEKAVQNVGGRHLILRSSWIYSRRRSNFVRTMLQLAETEDEITVVDDQIGTPTWAGWIADATATAVRHAMATGDDEVSGLYHLAPGGQTSWYGFARAIFARFGYDGVHVEPISSDEFPTQAPRPAHSVLDASRVRDVFDLEIPTWSELLARFQRRAEERDDRVGVGS